MLLCTVCLREKVKVFQLKKNNSYYVIIMIISYIIIMIIMIIIMIDVVVVVVRIVFNIYCHRALAHHGDN